VSIEEISAKLAKVAQQIELHRTAIWLLEDERLLLQQQLRAANWTPPKVSAEAA
jgi:hypothetical protein